MLCLVADDAWTVLHAFRRQRWTTQRKVANVCIAMWKRVAVTSNIYIATVEHV